MFTFFAESIKKSKFTKPILGGLASGTVYYEAKFVV